MSYSLAYKDFGEAAILIEWPQSIDDKILLDIINFKEEIEKKLDIHHIELIPAYNSLTVINHNKDIKLQGLKEELKRIYTSVNKNIIGKQKLWEIPVCYDETFGIDLEHICEEKGMSKEELIQLHSEAIYTVYCIGFLPGFMYLGGLSKRLETPRRETPRLNILKGSVGIAENQTGVYPQDSPGGWNIIGNSPINLFDINKETPCFVKTGDKIQFRGISLPEYKLMQVEIEAGVFSIESKWIQ
ncbi:5-oxoprolinase subunit PxpB [Flavobacteriaceae bacterium R38]|nr:5-oxoprolinase subunit PxpB [Flavobacteriaceae bacterium R38]